MLLEKDVNHLDCYKRLAEFESAPGPWKGQMLPLHHRRRWRED